ncbi:pilus assembly protein TadG-related protein [Primorskyibacter aestuariivivens]|uniref:pilus assembly protein TadG-related protein n=1 Tax=Primorskyibacter aestuariivivens TaxID=1888912 RepID=UPI0022FFCC72|nr:pilus assembly protein TadG-related protein [Primorskyibacter aestuariivivens]MDA7427628.1 pilus assembly protein TadG-related protein [Primorskyibacter aestuariivivens]
MVNRFLRSQEGYVLILSLLLLPVFCIFALLIIDVTRGNNAHGDLQSAADAMALAAARELDGEPGAINRARGAMEQLSNSVSMLDRNASEAQNNLDYTPLSSSDSFDVAFLERIPTLDSTPINSVFATEQTNDDSDAAYVYVAAQSQDLEPLFNRILGLSNDVPVSAWAVATYSRTACDVAPVYICNPFEPETTDASYTGSTTDDYGFVSTFTSGNLHGRLFDLFYSTTSSSGAGNWGFLRLPGSRGTSDARDALAGYNPTCYEEYSVDAEPGNFDTAAASGWNVRFGQYSGAMNSKPDDEIEMHYSPDINVAHNYGDNDSMLLPTHADGMANGRYGGSDLWNLDGVCRVTQDPSAPTTVEDTVLESVSHDNADPINYEADCTAAGGTWEPGYWEVRHGTPWDPTAHNYDAIIQQYPDMIDSERATFISTTMPSRYDIYRYENSLGSSYQETAPEHSIYAQSDRRESFVAVVNCNASDIQGSATGLDTVANMTIFVAEPSPTTGSTSSLKFEVTDMTGFTGSTSLNEKFREESELVR